MIEVTETKAVDTINTYPLVHVTWHKENCPVCEYFLPELEGIEESLSEWKFLSVNSTEHRRIAKQVLWEPTTFPITYLFVNGVRIFVAAGAAPLDAVVQTHNAIAEGTWVDPNREVDSGSSE